MALKNSVRNAQKVEFQDLFFLTFLLLNLKKLSAYFKKYNLNFTFLVTPETSDERIQYLDSLSSGFLYAVSSSSTTGNENTVIKNENYLTRLADLPLKNPVMIGFGIKSKQDFENVTEKADGGIIGTAFVNVLLQDKDWKKMP